VGTSKRYAHVVDAAMDARVSEQIMRSGEPQSLTDDERQVGEVPLTTPPRAMPVRAWVRYPAGPLEVDAEIVAWTPRAAALRWRGPGGSVHRAWVWASAVDGR